MHQFGVTK